MAAAFALGFNAPCVADYYVLCTMNTAQLLKACRGAEDTLQFDCASYILGVFDQMVLSDSICPQPNPSGLTAQVVAVALKFFNDHPEKWGQPPAALERN